ncbi:MAG TPA: SDR family oxidoreductase [Solirubrobacteraceae bacterium]|jgi:NAD(P)-dependent dehydrogenase (short-subunit alcohol dehydrogenase family)|nr:SDR family oxidoreductase [Solirubrobacteraceae bacterium]
MKGRICAITGASSGLGFETALALARMDATVVLLCRSERRGAEASERIAALTGKDDLHVVHCDHANLDTVRDAASVLLERFDALHVLVNNAGLMVMQRRITVDGLEETFQVNHLSAFLLTALLRERLAASAPARVVTVSSLAHHASSVRLDDLQGEQGYDGWHAYCRSKLCNLLFTYELARRLEGSGVTANALHPGLVRTAFGRDNGTTGALMRIAQLTPLAVSARHGARTQAWLASAPEVERVSGRYFHGRHERHSSRASHNREAQRGLWAASDQLLAGQAGESDQPLVAG